MIKILAKTPKKRLQPDKVSALRESWTMAWSPIRVELGFRYFSFKGSIPRKETLDKLGQEAIFGQKQTLLKRGELSIVSLESPRILKEKFKP